MSQLSRVQFQLTQLLLREPFYGALALRLKLVEDPAVETFQTNGRRIAFNPEFAATLSDGEVRGVICHEITHLVGQHQFRAPAGCDWDMWNRAADYEVNALLEQENERARSRGQPEPYPVHKSFLLSPEFTGQAAEKIYWELKRREAPGDGREEPPQGNAPPQPGASGTPSLHHSTTPPAPPSPGEIVPPPADPAEAAQLQQSWQSAVLAAAKAAQGRGHLPGGMLELVHAIRDPQVPWTHHCRDWLTQVAQENWNWLRRNHAYAGTGFFLPTLRSKKIGRIVFAKDTSGSINADLLTQFVSEAQGALDELNPETLVVIDCDAKVQFQKEYTPGDTVERTCRGRGGTSFVPVFEEIDRWDEPPVAVVYLTDLNGTFPSSPPDYPVLWVTWEKHKRAPFGDTIDVK